jgi:hypothetical protein
MQDTITALIEERDIITVNFAEKEIVKVNFKVLDVIQYYRKYIESGVVKEDAIIVSSFPTKRFTTSLPFVDDTLSVYLNGINEKFITVIDNQTFDLPINVIEGDTVRIEYIELI